MSLKDTGNSMAIEASAKAIQSLEQTELARLELEKKREMRTLLRDFAIIVLVVLFLVWAIKEHIPTDIINALSGLRCG